MEQEALERISQKHYADINTHGCSSCSSSTTSRTGVDTLEKTAEMHREAKMDRDGDMGRRQTLSAFLQFLESRGLIFMRRSDVRISSIALC